MKFRIIKNDPDFSAEIENEYGDSIAAVYSTFESFAPVLAAAPDLLREITHLVRLLQPLENDGRLNVPGLATLNGARAAIEKAHLPYK